MGVAIAKTRSTPPTEEQMFMYSMKVLAFVAFLISSKTLIQKIGGRKFL